MTVVNDEDVLLDSMLAFMSSSRKSLPILRLFLSENMRPLIRFMNDNSPEMVDTAGMMRQIYRMNKVDHETVSKDAWSYGQLHSKMWLIKTLNELDMNLGNVWVLCGWIGTLPLLINHFSKAIRYDSIRSFDLDPRCAPLAEILNNKLVADGWKFKASTMDVNSIVYDEFKYETLKDDGTIQALTGNADTVVNTSCEHLVSNKWWDNIPPGRQVILQSNDFFDHSDHGKPVADLNEMQSRYPMRRVLFKGELDCELYKRFMLIGMK